MNSMAMPVELALSQDMPGRDGNRLGISMLSRKITMMIPTIFCLVFSGGRGFLFNCSRVRFFSLLTSGRRTNLANSMMATAQAAPKIRATISHWASLITTLVPRIFWVMVA